MRWTGCSSALPGGEMGVGGVVVTGLSIKAWVGVEFEDTVEQTESCLPRPKLAAQS